MQTINKEEALKRLASLENETKELRRIIDTPLKITDRVNNFNDVLAIAGKTMADMAKSGDTPDEVAYRQAKLIAEVYNEGTVLDAYNTNQYKYYPWHKISGSGLAYFHCAGWNTFATVGVRLCFKDENLAMDAGKKFLEIYTILKTK